uniref:Cadmium-induced protein AS8 isoform X1 n=1 Tax=Elaeis guineensis var. tenera TaxID=51953 RepID=A0A6I9QCZ3_ELAGV|nr:cadmium-induced protein AS8 isoform X1 [Elaeis guineensis]
MPQVQPRRRETDVNGKLLVMIIKGLLRRYERWNPVHPTVGAFWGMGIGLGCGVGWGPGFGPEVVGYVGAGCGVGFSVGVTLAGVGVGLPRNGLIRIPLNAFITGSGSLESARSYALTTVKSVAEDGLNYVAPHISFWRKENSGRLSSCKTNIHFDHRVKLTELSKTLSMHIRSTLECFEAVKDQCWPPRKDT